MTATILPIITLILGYLGTVLTEDRRARRDMVAADRRAARELEIEALREIQSAMIEVIHYVNVLVLGTSDSTDSFSPATGYVAAIHKLEARRARQSSEAVDKAVRKFLAFARPLIPREGRDKIEPSIVSDLSTAMFATNELVQARFRTLGLFVSSEQSARRWRPHAKKT